MARLTLLTTRTARLLALAALASTSALLPACSSSSSHRSSASGSQAGAANALVIKNFSFMPGSTTVKAGTTVTWTNRDTTAHSVVSDNGGPLKSPAHLDPGATYVYTFTKPGTFSYHCGIHQYMTGTVTVT